jgi:DNA-binding NtrC family response regulator
MNQPKRVLIIEEEVDLCLLMKTYFLRKNYEVAISQSCREALSLANEIHPNIIFISSAVSREPEDIPKLKASFPGAEIIMNDQQKYPDV